MTTRTSVRARWAMALGMSLLVACSADDAPGPGAEDTALDGSGQGDVAVGDVGAEDADVLDSADDADTADAADVADTADVADAADDSDATEDSDAADTTAAADTTDAADVADAADVSDTADVADAGPPTEGARLYETYCAFCHGSAGEGYLADHANALANATFLETATDDFLRDAIIHGRPGTPMSAWGQVRGGPLDDAQVDLIVEHVRAWQSTPTLDVHDVVVDGSALRGQSVYEAACVECHGTDGSGVNALSLNNPWFHATASDGFIRHAIDVGRPGTDMDGFGEIFTDRNMDDLVVYLRTWAREPDTDPPPVYEPDLSTAVLNPDGERASFDLREGRFAAADDVWAAMQAGQSFVLVDARPTNDFLTSHITGAINLPFYDIGGYVDDLPRDVFIIAYCGCPHAVSGQAVDVLLGAGFVDVAVLDEGFYVWQERGYAVSEGLPAP